MVGSQNGIPAEQSAPFVHSTQVFLTGSQCDLAPVQLPSVRQPTQTKGAGAGAVRHHGVDGEPGQVPVPSSPHETHRFDSHELPAGQPGATPSTQVGTQ